MVHCLPRLEANGNQGAGGEVRHLKLSRDLTRRFRQGAFTGQEQRNSVIQFLILEKKSRIESGGICPYLVDIHHGDLRMPVKRIKVQDRKSQWQTKLMM